MKKKLSVTPSAISFALGDASCSDFNRPCLRYTLVQRNTHAKTDIPAIYTALGEIDEHRFSHHLEALGFKSHEKKLRFRRDYKDIEIKGEIDFKGETDEGTVILDKKSTISTSTRSKMRKGIISKDYVAQVAMYMGVYKAVKGIIIQSFYEFDYYANSLTCTEEIKHTIIIKDNKIYLNGKIFEYTISDLRSWLSSANHVLTTNTLASRPLERKACAGCPLNSLCERVESSDFSPDSFIKEGAQLIQSSVQSRDPQIFRPKRAVKQLRYHYRRKK